MKFLVDAQLPRRFCSWLADADHDAKHTLELPLRNHSPDSAILDIAEQEGRIVVTKDDDFVQSFLLTGRPGKLLLVATGNIGNSDLEKLVRDVLPTIATAFETYNFVELGRESLTVHE